MNSPDNSTVAFPFSLLRIWRGLAFGARAGIIAGAAMIMAVAVALGMWAYHTDYQVLFADMQPRDAAAMTSELDRLKVPYQLEEGGGTILVPGDLVHKTRLKLMAKDIPLHGAVGFEVFNHADFGMTEFVQKVNYQRAVRGELTRTILAIEDIQSARVHLALPEQGLFKKNTTRPKASVTLTMKAGRVLAPEQTAGIQRLVAASVPDIAAADVTVLDQHGVALTRVVSENAAEGVEAAGTAHTQFDAKRSMEEYLTRKVMQVLEKTFGAGAAIASVDVTLNHDRSRVTTEEVLPAKSPREDASPAGVVVRERQTMRADNGERGGQGELSTLESDFQVGRRTEQVVTAAGEIRRISIAVVVKSALGEEQRDKLKEVVALAAGLSSQRGDAIVVQTLDRLTAGAAAIAEDPSAAVQPPQAGPLQSMKEGRPTNGRPTEGRPTEGRPTEGRPTEGPPAAAHTADGGIPMPAVAAVPGAAMQPAAILLVLLLATTGLGACLYRRQGKRNRTPADAALSGPEREALLAEVRHWIAGPAPAQSRSKEAP